MSYSSTILATAGLVAYWRLNQSGTVTFSNNAAQFGGTPSDHIDMPNLNLAGANTLEMIVYPTSVADDVRLWGSHTSSHAACRFNHSGGMDVTDQGASWQQVAPAGIFTENRWYHLIFTRASGGSMKLIVNGTRIGKGNQNGNQLDDQLDFGRQFGGNGTPFAGKMQSIAAYNIEFTHQQAIDHYLAIAKGTYDSVVIGEASVQAYWKLNEASGTTATDSVGSNNGTYTGTFTLNQSGAIVYPVATDLTGNNHDAVYSNDTAVTLNTNDPPAAAINDKVVTLSGTGGGNGFITVPPLGINGTCTLELWFKPSSLGTDKRLYDAEYNYGSAGGDLDITINQDGSHSSQMSQTVNGTWHLITDAASLTVNTWHHLVLIMTHTGTWAMQAYINGVAQVSNGGSDAAAPFNIAGYFGRPFFDGGTFSGNPFLGEISNISIYNVALSQSDVTAHYNAATVAAPARGGSRGHGGKGGGKHRFLARREPGTVFPGL